MSQNDSFTAQLPQLIAKCKMLSGPRNVIYLCEVFGTYFVTKELPEVAYSVVKEPYQFVPPCCENRWFHKALLEAHHRLNNLRANDNAD